MPNHHPAIIALYRATEDPEDLARFDAFRAKVRNAALCGIIRERAELAACPADATGWLASHRAVIRAEIRRAAEYGATDAEIRAALTAAPVKA
ncbi:hypothetical protein [Nocardia abscessus]|uniref:hypothetical protein n=1 Tax=Nocardia abscessus TaxID=120957 RepID=UPI002454B6E6|nr:hypothetical protein [Nocardia abscessus]